MLAVGVKADITAIKDKVSDAGFVGQLAGDVERPLSAYLRAHQGGAKYEVAAESATQIGSLIVKDALPIAVLTTYNGRVYTTIGKLKRMIAAGQVRYAYLSTFCTHKASSVNAACAAFSKALADLGKRDGVQVNCIHPSLVDTDRQRGRIAAEIAQTGASEAQVREKFCRDMGTTRFGTPQDVANLVCFIVSQRGSWLQGATIDLDGGEIPVL